MPFQHQGQKPQSPHSAPTSCNYFSSAMPMAVVVEGDKQHGHPDSVWEPQITKPSHLSKAQVSEDSGHWVPSLAAPQGLCWPFLTCPVWVMPLPKMGWSQLSGLNSAVVGREKGLGGFAHSATLQVSVLRIWLWRRQTSSLPSLF